MTITKTFLLIKNKSMNIEEIINDYCFELLYINISEKKNIEKFSLLNNFLKSKKYKGTLYRRSVMRDITKIKIGDIIDYTKRITSWSKKLEICLKFQSDGINDNDFDINKTPIFKLNAYNADGYDISSLNPNEDEVLLASGIRMIVTNICNEIVEVSII